MFLACIIMKYLDFLKSQNLESIVEPAEKEFQEKIKLAKAAAQAGESCEMCEG